jgi:hypothetical protein
MGIAERLRRLEANVKPNTSVDWQAASPIQKVVCGWRKMGGTPDR